MDIDRATAPLFIATLGYRAQAWASLRGPPRPEVRAPRALPSTPRTHQTFLRERNFPKAFRDGRRPAGQPSTPPRWRALPRMWWSFVFLEPGAGRAVPQCRTLQVQERRRMSVTTRRSRCTGGSAGATSGRQRGAHRGPDLQGAQLAKVLPLVSSARP